MKLTCPGCGNELAPGDAPGEGPGTPLCKACCEGNGAVPPPRPSVSSLLGLEDGWGNTDTVLDGGFSPTSTRPGKDAPELGTDVEAVSLRELQSVLAPQPPPPAWMAALEPKRRTATLDRPFPSPPKPGARASVIPAPIKPVIPAPKPRVEKPAIEKPVAEKPIVKTPAQLKAEKAEADRAAAEKLAAEHAAVAKAAAEKAEAARLAAEKAEKARVEAEAARALAEQLAEEAAAESLAADKLAAAEKQAAAVAKPHFSRPPKRLDVEFAKSVAEKQSPVKAAVIPKASRVPMDLAVPEEPVEAEAPEATTEPDADAEPQSERPFLLAKVSMRPPTAAAPVEKAAEKSVQKPLGKAGIFDAPPPVSAPAPISAEPISVDPDDDERGPSSGLFDLRGLAAPRSSPPQRADDALFSLSGGLFADAPPSVRFDPPDVSPIAPVLDLDAPIVPKSTRPPKPAAKAAPQPPKPAKPSAAPARSGAPPAPLAGSEEEIAVDVDIPSPPRTPTSPPVVVSERPRPSPPAKPARKGAWVVGALALAAAAVVAFRVTSKGDDAPASQVQKSAPTAATTEAAPVIQPTARATEEPAAPVAVATSTGAAAPSDKPAAPVVASKEKEATPSAHAPVALAPKEPAAPAESPKPVAPKPEAPPVVAAAPPPVAAPPPAAAPPPPPAGGGGEFNRAAAKSALASAAAAAAGCKQPDDQPGAAKITVTFSPSGRVSSALVTGGSLQGTRSGGCIAAAFHGISVPPFQGDPVTVFKDVAVH